jgi:hypothetical protein
MTMQVNDDEIKDLLEDAFKKIESKATQDSKLLSDMNNALNWILSLTTVMFVLYIRLSASNVTSLNQGILHFSRVLFALLIIILILHKIILLRYEKAKGHFIESLRTHYIDLKFDISLLKSKYNFNAMPGIENFTSNLENGIYFFITTTPCLFKFAKANKKICICFENHFLGRLINFLLVFF